jgi:hypothetical protein
MGSTRELKRKDYRRGVTNGSNLPPADPMLSARYAGLPLLARALGNRTVASLLQAKLSVSKPNDPLEQEADRVAEQVLRSPTPPAAKDTGHGPGETEGRSRQEPPSDRIHRGQGEVASRSGGASPSDDLIGDLGSGHPLEYPARDFFESRFGADFGAVRVHTDGEAARSARAIGARAYAFGNHIVFARGEYQPRAASGQRLLAHELAHVMQQGFGRPRLSGAEGAVGGRLPAPSPPIIARQLGFSPQPRSLNQSLAPSLLRDDELAAEIQEIRQWLLNHPYSSADRTMLEQALAELEAEVMRRPTIATRGTVAHTGTVGTGATRGTVEARTNEEIQTGTARAGNLIAISYSGANAANARWFQFVWFEMEVVSPALTGRVSATIPTTSGTKPFTTNPASPSWSVDSADGISPDYIYSGGIGIRDTATHTMFDQPGGTSVAPLFQAVLSAVSGATSATFTAHFSTYLVINDVVTYHVPWAAATTATVSGTTATIANVAYTVGAAGAASSLPTNLRTILHTNYPSYTGIR